jgi:hypothetical protein
MYKYILIFFLISCNKIVSKNDNNSKKIIYFITSYGQSNSNGGGQPLVISHFQKYNSLMPFSGPRSDSSDKLFPLIPLTEQLSESPISGAAEVLVDLLKKKINKIDFQIVSTATGQGGYPIYYLSKNIRPFQTGKVSPYNRILDQVKRIKYYYDSLETPFVVPFIYFTQGESEYEQIPKTTYSEYLKLYNNLVNDLNADIKIITNQSSKPIKFIGYQITDGIFQGSNYTQAETVSKVQYDLAIDPFGSYIIACPSYIFRYQLVDHFLPNDARIYGAYLALAAKQTYFDEKKFIPMHPIKISNIGNVINIKFYVPNPPLIIDNQIPLADNYGFRLVRNSLTNDTVKINSVKVINENTIQIISSLNAKGLTLYYAVDPQNKPTADTITNSFYFPSRGNVHDSQNFLFDGKSLYNYLTRFYLKIP